MENTIENNKLIADFMGIPFDGKYYLAVTTHLKLDERNYSRTVQDLRFRTSWDWLMPCVLKIGTIEDSRYRMAGNFEVKISNTYVWVDPPIGDRIYFSGNSLEDRERPLIEKVYEGVVTFIKWYNKN